MTATPDFGTLLRQLRTDKRLGLRMAAKQIDISPTYLSRLEHNEAKPPSGQLLHRIAKTYGVPVKLLFNAAPESRKHETIAHDTDDVKSFIYALYRAAQDQPARKLDEMLDAVLDVSELSTIEKQYIRDLFRNRPPNELLRLATGDEGLFSMRIQPRHLSANRLEQLALQVLHDYYKNDTVLWPWVTNVEKLVESFADSIHLRVENELPGGLLADGSPRILGLSRWNGLHRELVIHEHLFESDHTPTTRRCNFTLAHELFHCIEHLPLVRNKEWRGNFNRAVITISTSTGSDRGSKTRGPKKLLTDEDWREWQANRFAAALLMPKPKVIEAFQHIVEEVACESGDMVDFDYCLEFARIPAIEIGEDSLVSLHELFNVNPYAMAVRLANLVLP